MKANGVPEKVTMDKSGANKAAMDEINGRGETPIIVRQVKYLVCGWASHLDSMLMIRHRPHEGNRGDDESIIDSRAPSAARVLRGVQDFCSGAMSPARRIACRDCPGLRHQPEHGAPLDAGGLTAPGADRAAKGNFGIFATAIATVTVCKPRPGKVRATRRRPKRSS
jgi:hypothetical protein